MGNRTETWKRLWGYLRSQSLSLVAVAILTAMTSLLSLLGPYVLGKAIDDYVIPGDSAGLLRMCALLLAIYAGSSLVSWLQASMMAGVAQRVVKKMRTDVFAQLQKLPLSFFHNRTHGELMSRTTNDMDQVSETLNQGVTQLLSSMLMLFGSLIFMLMLNSWLTLASLITIPLVFFAAKKIAQHTRQYFSGQQKHLGELNGFIEETVSGQRVVKLFCREEITSSEFRQRNAELRKVSIKAQIYSGTMAPIMNLINHLNFIIVAALGSWMALEQWITIGVIVSFINYSKQFGRPIHELANQFNMLQSAIAGAERVFEIIDAAPETTVTEKQLEKRAIKGEISFQNVSFSYKKGFPVLQDITFQAKQGDMIALVGPTGAGKTTIVQLLARFYEMDQGAILIDGCEIQGLDKESVRKQLGFVLQDAYVFSDIILENIRYGRLEASDEEVKAAAALAQADDFIRKLPDGYGTMLSAEGSNLSQGQRQLITIARAILSDPAILILDEATSSIDTQTEAAIQQAMKTLMQERTSFVIAHRLSTIREADLILYVNGGRIVESGTHEELLNNRSFYYELYQNQFRKRTGSVP